MGPHGIAGKAALDAASLGHVETGGVEVGHNLGEVMRPHHTAVEAVLRNQQPGSSRGKEIIQHRLFQ